MTTQEIANQLVEWCRKGEYDKCYSELYDQECWSIEPKGAWTEEAKGMEEIAAKGKKWQENIKEMHESWVGEPVVNGNHFAVPMSIEATYADGSRNKTEEMCVYEVKNGKIIKEQFFY